MLLTTWGGNEYAWASAHDHRPGVAGVVLIGLFIA